MESFHKIYNLIESMVQSNLFFRECFLALDLSSILSKAEKYKASKSDDVGLRAEAGRYDKVVADMRTHPTLTNLLVEIAALGREKMAESARAKVGHSLEKELNSYEWSIFPAVF